MTKKNKIGSEKFNFTLPPLPFETRLTVLCDMTPNLALNVASVDRYLIQEHSIVGDYHIYNAYSGAPFAQQTVYTLLEEIFNDNRLPSILIIQGNVQFMALMVALTNSISEHKHPRVPLIDASQVRVWEVWEDEALLLTKEDGTVDTTTFDEALRPLVSQMLHLQRINAPEDERELNTDPGDELTEGTMPKIVQKAATDDAGQPQTLKEIIARRVSVAAARETSDKDEETTPDVKDEDE